MSKVRSTSKMGKSSRSRLDFENPLANPLILANIFEDCSVTTLKACRLVSKQWLEASTSAWRNQAVLTLECGPSESHRRQVFSKPPFRNYKLFEWDLTRRNASVEINYLKDCGSFFTRLVLSFCEFRPGQLEKFLFSNLFPNLKTLELVKNVFRGERLVEEVQDFKNLDKLHTLTLDLNESRRRELIFPVSYKTFFERIPNIKVFNVAIKFDIEVFIDEMEPEADEFGEMLRAIVEIRGKVGEEKLNIQHLDIIDVGRYAISKYPQSTRTQFKNLDWALKTLKLDVGYDGGGYSGWEIIKLHAQHLEELTLFRLPVGCHHSLSFNTEMKNLRTLHLQGMVNSDFYFLKHLPNLKVLHLFTNLSENEVSKMMTLQLFREDSPEYFDSEDEEDYHGVPGDLMVDLTSPLESCHHDTDLEAGIAAQLEELQGDIEIEDPDNFRKLTEWLPNVRKLRLPLTTKTFPIVCQRWRHSLRELDIPEGSDIDDEAFTGLTIWNWNIASLTKLTHLKVGEKEASQHSQGDSPSSLPQLTEVALNDGILLLPELQTLFMVLSSTSISERKLERLKSKINNLQLWGYDDAERKLRRLA